MEWVKKKKKEVAATTDCFNMMAIYMPVMAHYVSIKLRIAQHLNSAIKNNGKRKPNIFEKPLKYWLNVFTL